MKRNGLVEKKVKKKINFLIKSPSVFNAFFKKKSHECLIRNTCKKRKKKEKEEKYNEKEKVKESEKKMKKKERTVEPYSFLPLLHCAFPKNESNVAGCIGF